MAEPMSDERLAFMRDTSKDCDCEGCVQMRLLIAEIDRLRAEVDRLRVLRDAVGLLRLVPADDPSQYSLRSARWDMVLTAHDAVRKGDGHGE